MEYTNIANSVDLSLYPVAVLIDELRHDDLQSRLNSIRNLGTIATALGPERTREELVPFLQEIIDDDDEVLIALAEQLGHGTEWVGGASHAHVLIGPLEELCNVEEISVRDKATEKLRELATKMSQEQILRHFCTLISRLASHDWFTSRISVCSLLSTALPKVGEAKKDDLLKTYFRLCGDDTPMVRCAAANVLGGIAEALKNEEMLNELFQAFEKLSGDEQDSVRLLAINNCIVLGRLNSSPEWRTRILPVVKSCAEDKSWRVRHVMADNVKQLCEVFHTKAKTAVVPLYIRLLSDQEVEVRTVAAARIAAVAELMPTKEFLETLMPSIEKLTLPREQSQHVRASLAGSVLSLSPIFGSQLTVEYLVTIFLHLIRDESPDVRLKLIGTLGDLSTVVGIEALSQSLLPSIKELGKDRQWRVRLAVLDCMPALAKCLGESQFTTELSGLFMVWLVDTVHSVRAAAASNFRRLAEVMGLPWTETNVVPQLQGLLTHTNYLYRISAMLCVGSLSEVVGGAFLDKHLVPMVLKMATDPVPNVRFNAVKTSQQMAKACANASATALDNHIVPCLKRLANDEDPDVKFFAGRAIGELGLRPDA